MATSLYEKMFGTVRRGRGRPPGSTEIFKAPDADPELVGMAKVRAYAIVHEENKDRLAEVFALELEALSEGAEDVQ